MKKNVSNKKSQLLKVGLFLFCMGAIVVLILPFRKLRDEIFDEMKLLIYQEDINQDNETIENLGPNAITKEEEETTNNQAPEAKKKVNYTYVGQLSLPSIQFKRGFVSKDSKYNTINYNVTIAQEADYPDVARGNFILMAHSGDSVISFFDNLYKLQLGDKATVSYQAKVYYYQLVKIYKVDKTGKIAIYRDYKKKTLTLITCTHQNETKQSVYIFEQTKE